MGCRSKLRGGLCGFEGRVSVRLWFGLGVVFVLGLGLLELWYCGNCRLCFFAKVWVMDMKIRCILTMSDKYRRYIISMASGRSSVATCMYRKSGSRRGGAPRAARVRGKDRKSSLCSSNAGG